MSRPIAVGEHSHKELDPVVDLIPASLDFLEGGYDHQTDLDRMKVYGTPRSGHSAQCSFRRKRLTEREEDKVRYDLLLEFT